MSSLRSLPEIKDDVYAIIGTPEANAGSVLPASEVAKYINGAWRVLRQDVLDVAPSLFTQLTTLSLVDDTAFQQSAYIENIVAIQNSDDIPLDRIDPTGSANHLAGRGFESLYSSITPRNITDGSFTVRYLGPSGDLQVAPVSEATASGVSLTLTGDADGDWGALSQITNAYIGMLIYIHEGTDIGDLRVIVASAVSGANLNVTVDYPWATTPDATSVVSILPPWPQEYHQLLSIYAVAALPQDGFRQRGLEHPFSQPLHAGLMKWAWRRESGGSSIKRAHEVSMSENGEIL